MREKVDSIREAFEQISIGTEDEAVEFAKQYLVTSADKDVFQLAVGFYSGYKSQQAEVEQLEKENSEYRWAEANYKLEIERLKTENEAMHRAGEILYKQYDLVIDKNWEISPVMAGTLEALRDAFTKENN